MLKMFIKGKYYYHVFQHRHNELLQQDCLCNDLKVRLKVKATYHNSKAVELSSIM
ncbi:hypothetical protein [Neobacillus soli]|uniref:hypothetical protein n=1 Tax=Neobacillus soli TaxID=220688 RepID=UPI000AE1F72E|nr:hypothetical protein [Neobacillus soli]